MSFLTSFLYSAGLHERAEGEGGFPLLYQMAQTS